MKKIVAVCFLVLLMGLTYGVTTAINWQGANYTITTNKVLTAPYIKSSLYLQAQSTTTASVTVRGTNLIFTQSTDLYPLNFKAAEAITVNTPCTFGVIWYENNDR